MDAAARRAVAAKYSLEGRMSARFRRAAAAVPATKPSWTAVVSQPRPEPERPHRTCSSGPMALAVNHTDMARSSARERRARTLHFMLGVPLTGGRAPPAPIPGTSSDIGLTSGKGPTPAASTARRKSPICPVRKALSRARTRSSPSPVRARVIRSDSVGASRVAAMERRLLLSRFTSASGSIDATLPRPSSGIDAAPQSKRLLVRPPHQKPLHPSQPLGNRPKPLLHLLKGTV